MQKKFYLLAAVALVGAPTAAQARDGLPYLGVEGGLMKLENFKLDYERGAASIEDGLTFEHKTGFDVDLIAGYDFGLIRLEGELGLKRAGLEDVRVDPQVFATTGRPAIDGRTLAISAMANVLVDVGSNDGLQVYAGGGVGAARFDIESRITGPGAPLGAGLFGTDRSLAWQAIAGIRLPVSYNVDLGLKYRLFNSKLDFSDSNGGRLGEGLEGRFRSHSVLASLIFNLGAQPAEPVAVVAAPAPPPPAPPPPTQTCPDGSVILASDSCPAPPPPPPPPPPAPERG